MRDGENRPANDNWREGGVTAEVAIMNKLGVALAADSTVTIGNKTYDTTNKLFTLSKFHPVGILVYNGMEISTIPVEIVIKSYRARLGRTSKPRLEDYSTDFIKYVRGQLPAKRQEETASMRLIVRDRCTSILDRLKEECRHRTVSMNDPSLTSTKQVRRLLYDILDEYEQEIANAKKYPGLRNVSERRLMSLYPDIIEDRVRRDFGQFNMSSLRQSAAELLVAKDILSNALSGEHTGIVIAGYGSREHYPSLISHRTDGFIAGVLKILVLREERISLKRPASIYTLAQNDVSETVVQGIDPDYQRFIDEGVKDLLSGIPATVSRHFGITNRTRLRQFSNRLGRQSRAFISRMEDKRDRWFVGPIYDAVRFIDKSELATLAENLVAITALKRKISLQNATVGGPIDVAVISKNDGFVWIRRKYYFDETINRQFLQKYFFDATGNV